MGADEYFQVSERSTVQVLESYIKTIREWEASCYSPRNPQTLKEKEKNREKNKNKGF